MAVTTSRADVAAIARAAPGLGRTEQWVRSLKSRARRRDARLLTVRVDGRLAGYAQARIVRRGRRPFLRRLLHWLWSGPVPDGSSLVQPQRAGIVDELVLVNGNEADETMAALWQATAGWLRTEGVGEAQTAVAISESSRIRQWQQLRFAPLQAIIEWQGPVPEPSRQVREATTADREQLAHLMRREVAQQQAFAPHVRLIPHINWAHYAAIRLRHADTLLWVAEKDGRLCGFVEARVLRHGFWQTARLGRWLFPARAASTPPLAVIEEIYVDPARRREGLASELVLQAVRILQQQGVKRIQAAIWHSNDSSKQFAHRIGFRPVRIILRQRL